MRNHTATFGGLRTSSAFGQCRLVLHRDARPCPNDATGPDHVCDECRLELEDRRQAFESDEPHIITGIDRSGKRHELRLYLYPDALGIDDAMRDEQ